MNSGKSFDELIMSQSEIGEIFNLSTQVLNVIEIKMAK